VASQEGRKAFRGTNEEKEASAESEGKKKDPSFDMGLTRP